MAHEGEKKGGRLWQVQPSGLRPLGPDTRSPFDALRTDREWRIGSAADVRAIRAELGQRCLALGYPPRLVWRIRVAVSEIATNALLHASGGTCRAHWDRAGLYLWVVDGRPGLNVERVHRLLKARRRRPADRWRGHGLRIAASYSDCVVLEATEDGSQFLLYFEAPQGGANDRGACDTAGTGWEHSHHLPR